MTPLDSRYIALQREVGLYVTLAVSAVGFVMSFWRLGLTRWYWALLLWLVVSVVVAIYSYRWPAVEYRRTAYRVNEDGIEIHRGVLWREVKNVPRSRVQHTDVAQGPLERKYGLGRLVIYTAGTAHSRTELPGLAHETALEIRDHLLPRGVGDAV